MTTKAPKIAAVVRTQRHATNAPSSIDMITCVAKRAMGPAAKKKYKHYTPPTPFIAKPREKTKQTNQDSIH